eukprot:1159057-Pelagomonas_calceolata.AAC.2
MKQRSGKMHAPACLNQAGKGGCGLECTNKRVQTLSGCLLSSIAARERGEVVKEQRSAHVGFYWAL